MFYKGKRKSLTIRKEEYDSGIRIGMFYAFIQFYDYFLRVVVNYHKGVNISAAALVTTEVISTLRQIFQFGSSNIELYPKPTHD